MKDVELKQAYSQKIVAPVNGEGRCMKLMCMQSASPDQTPSSSTCSALRQVWVISRHYSDDTRMGLLLQRLACRLADRVAESIDIKACDCPSTRSKQLQTDTSGLIVLLLGCWQARVLTQL